MANYSGKNVVNKRKFLFVFKLLIRNPAMRSTIIEDSLFFNQFLYRISDRERRDSTYKFGNYESLSKVEKYVPAF